MRPPAQLGSTIMAESERAQSRIPATDLPPGLEAYRRTDTFSEESLPAGLLKAHSTKAGIWGLIQVTDGELLYRIEDERRIRTERHLRAGSPPGVVEPTVLHSVKPLGPVRFYVQFLRAAA